MKKIFTPHFKNVDFLAFEAINVASFFNYTLSFRFETTVNYWPFFQIRARLCRQRTDSLVKYVKGQFFSLPFMLRQKGLKRCLWNLLEHFSKMSIEPTLNQSVYILSSTSGLSCLFLKKVPFYETLLK